MEFITGLLGGIWGYLVAGVVAIAAIFGIAARSRSEGRRDAEADIARRDVRTTSEAADEQARILKEVNDAKSDVINLPTGDAERELHEHWTRSSNKDN